MDFDGDDMPATVAEFGGQGFYFTDADDVEVVSLSVPENTSSGMIGDAKLLSGTETFSLAGTSTNFAISSAGEITVQSAANLDYETENSFVLAIAAMMGGESTALK